MLDTQSQHFEKFLDISLRLNVPTVVKDLTYHFSPLLNLPIVVICSLEFIITYVECLFHQLLNKYITFQTDLEINNIKN